MVKKYSSRYAASTRFLKRAEAVIPLGSQTFSKSRTQYPVGVSPLFIERGQGCRVWDIDGNEYVDLVNSLGAIVLGYKDPEVDRAVARQWKNGVIFSLPHRLETETAELLTSVVPCAEQVRFGKNGSDVTTAAIRLARAVTGRDRVAVCGYHGWHDWYIGSTSMDRGVPRAVRGLTHLFPYNNIDALKKLMRLHKNQFAAVILEPMNVQEPGRGYLQAVCDVARSEGAAVVFDEMVTGFRFGLGGAQEYFGVTPDMATFGKALANGYPLSALMGKRRWMEAAESIFFSTTFGGETLSLAAAQATVLKLKAHRQKWVPSLRGARLRAEVERLIARHGLEKALTLKGHPAWTFLIFNDAGGLPLWTLKTLYLQEMFARGVLTLGTHTLSWAIQEKDVDFVAGVYDAVFAVLKRAISAGSVAGFLKCDPLRPLFKVR